MDEFHNSDEDIDDATHAKLIRNVLNLNSKQHVKKPSRTEPTLNISEYDLVKSGKGVKLLELTNALKGRGRKHVEIERKIRKAGKKGKTLAKPLEKPQADRVRRTVGYENVAAELDKWEPVVSSMRAAVQVVYPLQSKVNLKEEAGESKWRMKSDLEKELEEIQPKVEVVEVETEEKFPMSIKEMLEKRREAAKLRAYQSYKEAKARRQNKIKSKKFHRIQKRERVKQQMKEFELLQKTDPQAALEKLEEIERARAEERVSLRHKGTGKWAKNKQIRAKYDKDSRQVLAQQLAISRDLTQKQKLEGSDSEYEEKENENAVRVSAEKTNNPWINGANVQVSKEVDDFVSGYRKFWEEKNGVKEENAEPKVTETVSEIPVKKSAKNKKQHVNKVRKEKALVVENKRAVGTSAWEIVDVDKELIKFDSKVQKDMQARYETIKKDLAAESKPRKAKKTKPTRKKPDLSIPTKPTKPVIDEQLGETTSIHPDDNNDVAKLARILNEPTAPVQDIDPNKFIRAKKVAHLDTDIPDLVGFDEDERDAADQKDVITEAFQDDDIADSFRREKRDELKQNQVGNVDLALPGWGSWGGKDIKIPSRKRKRFMMRFPKKMPRKDKNKGNLIIKEGNSGKLKPHLVSEVPFPFKSVKDFEASIRAPIGNTFVPEIAHRKMIQPAVVTKMGAIIEPMTDDILLRKKK